MRGGRGGFINYPEIQNLLEQLRRQTSKVEEEVSQTDTPTPPGGPGTGGDGNTACAPVDFVDELSIATGLSHVETVIALNEYVYIAGFDDPNPKLKIYRIKLGGDFELISSLTLTQEIKRFVLHGPIIYGCNDGADGQNLISIDISDPWNPTEEDQLDVGFAAYGLDALGQYVFVVGGTTDIASVDISDPSAMVQVN